MRAKLKNPFYGPGNRYYRAGEIVDLPEEAIPTSAERLDATPREAKLVEPPAEPSFRWNVGLKVFEVLVGEDVVEVFKDKLEAQKAVEDLKAGNAQQD